MRFAPPQGLNSIAPQTTNNRRPPCCGCTSPARTSHASESPRPPTPSGRSPTASRYSSAGEHRWRSRSGAAWSAPGCPPASRPLTELLPPLGYSPDFLTPDLGGRYDLTSGVEAVLGTPKADLRRDLSRLQVSRPDDYVRSPPTSGPWPAATRVPAPAASGPERIPPQRPRPVLAPHPRPGGRRPRHPHASSAGGRHLRAAGEPPARTALGAPVLQGDYPVHRDLPLEGRGLLLQPSFFCTRGPSPWPAPT